MAINFTLGALDTSFNLDLSGTLGATAPVVLTTDATAVFYVKLSDMRAVFKYQTDAFDVNDISSSDIKYYVYKTNWPAALYINPAHAMMNKTESVSTYALSVYDTSKNLLKHDYLRYLSYRLFNTPFGVDLFSNDTALLETIATKGATVHSNIQTSLATVDTSNVAGTLDASGFRYFVNSDSTNTNLSRELLRQIASAAPTRFNNVTDTSGVQSIPFVVEDSINILLTVYATPGQNALTGVVAIPARTYTIKLVMKSDGNAVNQVVGDSAEYSAQYPYSS